MEESPLMTVIVCSVVCAVVLLFVYVTKIPEMMEKDEIARKLFEQNLPPELVFTLVRVNQGLESHFTANYQHQDARYTLTLELGLTHFYEPNRARLEFPQEVVFTKDKYMRMLRSVTVGGQTYHEVDGESIQSRMKKLARK